MLPMLSTSCDALETWMHVSLPWKWVFGDVMLRLQRQSLDMSLLVSLRSSLLICIGESDLNDVIVNLKSVIMHRSWDASLIIPRCKCFKLNHWYSMQPSKFDIMLSSTP